MNQTTLYHRTFNLLARCTTALCFLAISSSAMAFEELNEAQALLFDKAHLVNTENGQSISYSYRSDRDKDQPIEDKVTVSITAQVDEERRDVEIDFLSDERHMSLPPFSGYRGNPLIMAMLEHLVQKIGEDTGGGSLYFRNRIRDALASDEVVVKKQTMSVNDNEVEATVVEFRPFTRDPRMGADPVYGKAIFTISLSDTVPGNIIDMGFQSAPSAESPFSRQLTFIK